MFLNLILIVLYLMCLIISWVFIIKKDGTIFSSNFSTIIFYFYNLFVFLGGLQYSLKLFSENKIIGLQIYFSILLFMLIYSFLTFYFSKNTQKNPNINNRYNRIVLIIIIVLIIFSMYLYYSSIKIPIIELLKDIGSISKYSLARLRSNATNAIDYANKSYLYKFFVGYRNIFLMDFIFIITGLFMLEFLETKNNTNLFKFLLFLFISVFVSISNFEKAKIIYLFIYLFFVRALYFKIKLNKNIKMRKIFYLVIITLTLLIIMYINFMGVSDVISAVNSIFSRTFESSIKPLSYYFKVFPKDKSFLLGNSFSTLFIDRMLNRKIFQIEEFIMQGYIAPQNVKRGIVGTAPTFFVGEVYANFGYIGVVLSIIIFSFYVVIWEKFLSRQTNNLLGIAFYVYIAIVFSNTSISSLGQIITLPTIIGKRLIFLLFFYLSLKVKIK